MSRDGPIFSRSFFIFLIWFNGIFAPCFGCRLLRRPGWDKREIGPNDVADTAAMARAALSPEASAQHRVRTLEPPQGGFAPGGQHFATHQRFTRFILI